MPGLAEAGAGIQRRGQCVHLTQWTPACAGVTALLACLPRISTETDTEPRVVLRVHAFGPTRRTTPTFPAWPKSDSEVNPDPLPPPGKRGQTPAPPLNLGLPHGAPQKR